MGLGKTLSMISLIANDPDSQKVNGSASGKKNSYETVQPHVYATLVVVPPAREYMD